MLDPDDLQDIDHEAIHQARIKKLRDEIRELSARIAFAPSIRSAVGIGSIAAHYFGPFAGIAGAVVGYKIGGRVKMTDLDKRIIINKINVKREQLARLEKVDPANAGEIDGIMSAADLANHTYDAFEFTGKWLRFMGKPAVGFHAMVFGIPKSGKSILCTQFACYLANKFGTVLYVAAEEGFSMTLQKKVKEFADQNENLYYANIREYEALKTALANNNFRFVFLDSVNFMKITPEQMREIKQLNPETAFVTVQQATKDGKFRGSQEYAHDADIIINVDAGIAHQQGRFCEPTVMRVFPKGSQHNPEPEFADEGEDESADESVSGEVYGGADMEY